MIDKETHINYENLQDFFSSALENIQTLAEIIDVTKIGLKATKKLPDILDLLIKAHGSDGEHNDFLKRTSNLAITANLEVENDFPFMHSQGAIMFYSHLESSIKRLIICIFSNSDIIKIKELSSLKIGLSEYMSLDESERLDYLFAQFEKSTTTGIQYGVTRFEKLLQPLNLSGPVQEEISKPIFELSQVRNNLLHRNGIADSHLIKSCPWLNYRVGDKIIITSNRYSIYLDSMLNYLILLAVRIGRKREMDVSDMEDLLKNLPNGHHSYRD